MLPRVIAEARKGELCLRRNKTSRDMGPSDVPAKPERQTHEGHQLLRCLLCCINTHLPPIPHCAAPFFWP
eukprot:5988984-Prorocentrum_lima.AAC.1